MDISLIAKMKKYDDFIVCYKKGDERKKFKGKSLLFYSLSNNDAESRYLITSFLLDEGSVANETNECGENLLHILLSRANHKNAWGKTPLEIAEQMPYRAGMLERMKKCK